jgi:aspartate aminotransferase
MPTLAPGAEYDAPVGHPPDHGPRLGPARPGDRAARRRAELHASRHVVEAARVAYAAGDTHYVPNAGVGELRRAIAGKVTRPTASPPGPSRSSSPPEAPRRCTTPSRSRCPHGDEVLIPDPGGRTTPWPCSLLRQARAGALPPASGKRLPAGRRGAGAGWSPTGPAVIVVNTRPTRSGRSCRPATSRPGRFAEGTTVAGVRRVLRRADLRAGARQPRPLRPRRPVLSAFSFSKTYAMTALRVGYPRDLGGRGAGVGQLQEPMVACVNAPRRRPRSRPARPPGRRDGDARRYRERRDLALAALDAPGMDYLTPEGAFYLWVDVRDRTGGDVDGWRCRCCGSTLRRGGPRHHLRARSARAGSGCPSPPATRTCWRASAGSAGVR